MWREFPPSDLRWHGRSWRSCLANFTPNHPSLKVARASDSLPLLSERAISLHCISNSTGLIFVRHPSHQITRSGPKMPAAGYLEGEGLFPDSGILVQITNVLLNFKSQWMLGHPNFGTLLDQPNFGISWEQLNLELRDNNQTLVVLTNLDF